MTEQATPGAGSGLALEAVRRLPVRLSAELGRATLPLARAADLADGAVVPLDRRADDPVDILVNGRRFATGRLLAGDGEWSVQIEEILEGGTGVPGLATSPQ